ncbi:MAG: methyltransferase domain-containing protein [Vicinamibacterales bacterium]
MSPGTAVPIEQHNVEIARNLASWNRKPLLRRVYQEFHRRLAAHIDANLNGLVVELGSGIGNIRDVIPGCLRTDLFPNPWIDQVENAYRLTFSDQQVSHLILFDVFHHLRYPRTALVEFDRVLPPGGRVIVFDPYISLAGRVVYGPLHHEPIGWSEPITPVAPATFDPREQDYYAAQGNATRIFWNHEYPAVLDGWEVVAREAIGAWPYALSGGYSKPQVYPTGLYPLLDRLDRFAAAVPKLSALRTLVVLKKIGR